MSPPSLEDLRAAARAAEQEADRAKLEAETLATRAHAVRVYLVAAEIEELLAEGWKQDIPHKPRISLTVGTVRVEAKWLYDELYTSRRCDTPRSAADLPTFSTMRAAAEHARRQLEEPTGEQK